MPFINYSSANVARAELDAGILASATVILLKSGQGDLFPSSFPFFAVLEAYVTGAVTKREVVKVTGKTDDTLAVVRSAGYCPASETATAQTNTAFAFSSGASFTHILTAEQQNDVQDEVVRLETDKLDKAGDLRTGLTAKRVLITDALGNETYLSGTSGQVVGFDGDGDPVAVTPTVDIDSLTHKPDPDFDVDPLIVFSDADSANRKVFLDDIRASDAEAGAGTENAKFMTPKLVKDNYGVSILASDSVLADAWIANTTSTVYVKLKEIEIMKSGNYRTYFGIRSFNSNNVYWRIYKNDVAIGTERITNSSSMNYFSEDFNFVEGDLIQVWARISSATTAYIDPFQMRGSSFPTNIIPVVNF